MHTYLVRHQTKNNIFQALALFKLACDAETSVEPDACLKYSEMLLTGVEGAIKKDVAKALPYAAKACDLGQISGCLNTSLIFWKGDGVPKDERRARIYANMARDLEEHMKEMNKYMEYHKGDRPDDS